MFAAFYIMPEMPRLSNKIRLTQLAMQVPKNCAFNFSGIFIPKN